MSDRIEQDTEQKSSSDNYHHQIVMMKDHFLSLIPSDFVTYQLTLNFVKDRLNSASYSADRVKNAIETIYKRINEEFVHPRRYAQEPHKQFMPYLLAMIEFDDKVMFHAHCLLATHPMITNLFDELCVYNTFQQFDDRVSSSHFTRTLPDSDAKDIENYTDPTNVTKWINYMMKKNSSAASPKKPDDLLVFAPKQ